MKTPMFSWKQWRVGLLIAVLLSLCVAGAGLSAGMGWKPFVAVFCSACLTNLGAYLKQHPIDQVEDDTTKPAK